MFMETIKTNPNRHISIFFKIGSYSSSAGLHGTVNRIVLNYGYKYFIIYSEEYVVVKTVE